MFLSISRCNEKFPQRKEKGERDVRVLYLSIISAGCACFKFVYTYVQDVSVLYLCIICVR